MQDYRQVGTAIELLADSAAFEVEFSDRNGRTYESVGLQKRANHGVIL
jgi:hypothetical protein